MNKSIFAITDLKGIDLKKRRIPILASTTEKDRDGEVVLPIAFRKTLTRYLTDNPVILASHNYRGDSVGKAVDFKIGPNGIGGYVEFADTVEGEKYWKLYKGGYQRAFSIGWMGSKWFEPNPEKDVKDGQIMIQLEDMSDPIKINHDPSVRRYLIEGEILETSVCAIPCNRGAISQLSVDEVKSFFGDITESELKGLEEIVDQMMKLAGGKEGKDGDGTDGGDGNADGGTGGDADGDTTGGADGAAAGDGDGNAAADGSGDGSDAGDGEDKSAAAFAAILKALADLTAQYKAMETQLNEALAAVKAMQTAFSDIDEKVLSILNAHKGKGDDGRDGHDGDAGDDLEKGLNDILVAMKTLNS